ncbi:hypothetical protein MNBD_BACTEROID06-63 [hydrothermal vent metagenome]|uniref:Uncharacterized protein n=1 Tax=hydrothermal vent metagenome TaxID=652676 RepID=A0A3B0URW7_9ZZZZ
MNNYEDNFYWNIGYVKGKNYIYMFLCFKMNEY